jgi:origin of replication binding protein
MGFTEAQKRAIESKARAVLVVAGPGSGKTTVLTERLVYLLKNGAEAKSCLLLSFTRASSKEMALRFAKRGIAGNSPHFSTIHALCLSLLREVRGIEREGLVNLYEKMDWLSAYFLEKGIAREEVEELLLNYGNQISYFKSITEEERMHFLREEKNEDFLPLFQYYEKMRKLRGKLDFEDLLIEVLLELQKNTRIADSWKSRFSYILVDEFQDLSLIQYAILKALSEKGASLFVVGDEDQSIYGFRGASPDILFRFAGDFPDCERIFLADNFRSKEEIVLLSRRLIGKNKKRFQKPLSGRRGRGGKAKYFLLETGVEEAVLLAEHVESLLREGCPPEEIAVLCRSKMQITPLLPGFMERGIPIVIVEELSNVFQHFIGKDILAYLRLAKNKESSQELVQILSKPYRGLRREKILHKDSGLSDLKRAAKTLKEREETEKLEKHLEALSKLNPKEAILFIRKEIGYEKYLEDFAKKKNKDFTEWWESFEEITAMSEGYPDLDAFFRFVTEFNRRALERRKPEEEKGIRFMTYHSAKGLEFDEVFLPDCIEGIIPDGRAKKPEEIEEERRSFYVALTRARKGIHIYVTKTRYSKKVYPSRFIPELLEGS